VKSIATSVLDEMNVTSVYNFRPSSRYLTFPTWMCNEDSSRLDFGDERLKLENIT
jgi:hypothetical protein